MERTTTGASAPLFCYATLAFNDALLSINSGTPAERAESRRLYTEHRRLSEMYRKQYAQGLPR